MVRSDIVIRIRTLTSPFVCVGFQMNSAISFIFLKKKKLITFALINWSLLACICLQFETFCSYVWSHCNCNWGCIDCKC